MIALFRHLEAVIHECGLEEEHFPYHLPFLSDSNNLAQVTVVALTDIADINSFIGDNVHLPDLPIQADSNTPKSKPEISSHIPGLYKDAWTMPPLY